jgi:hypothetical protein
LGIGALYAKVTKISGDDMGRIFKTQKSSGRWHHSLRKQQTLMVASLVMLAACSNSAQEVINSHFNDVECIQQGQCELVTVLYGTTRQIDFSVPPEQDGEYVDANATPFLDEFHGASSEVSLGYIALTVPNSASVGPINNYRPTTPTFLRRFFGVSESLDGTKHYVFRGYDDLDRADMTGTLAAAPRAFVYIHGYQEPMIKAAFRTAQIKKVGNFDGQAMIFSWPSINGLSENNYHLARRNAAKSADALRDFLTLASQSLDGRELHIIAHSMGNYALLQALEDLNRSGELSQTNVQSKPFSQLIMAAPDVSRIEYDRLIQQAGALADGTTLYASNVDVAMVASQLACKRRRNKLEDALVPLSREELAELDTLRCDRRAGFVPAAPNNVPAIASGVDTLDATTVESSRWYKGIAGMHGYAFTDVRVFEDMGQVMTTNGPIPISQRADLDCLTQDQQPCQSDENEAEEPHFWRFR